MDASAFEIDAGLSGLRADQQQDQTQDQTQDQVQDQRTPSLKNGGNNGGHGPGASSDRRFIARDWFNVNCERDCELMQIFIEQLNGTNHVNYSKAYLLFKERTGFPFSDPKHMRKRMDQIVYTFKTQGEMLPENVKRKITEYNGALEAAKQRDSSNRKRLILMEPVEADDTRSGSGSGNVSDSVSEAEAEVEARAQAHTQSRAQAQGISHGISQDISQDISSSNSLLGLGSKKKNGSSMNPTGLTMRMAAGASSLAKNSSSSSSSSRKRKYANVFAAEEPSDRTLNRLAENVERLTRMLQSHDVLLNRIVTLLEGDNGARTAATTSANGNHGAGDTRGGVSGDIDQDKPGPSGAEAEEAAVAAAAAAAAAANSVLNLNPPSLAAAKTAHNTQYGEEEDGEHDHVTRR